MVVDTFVIIIKRNSNSPGKTLVMFHLKRTRLIMYSTQTDDPLGKPRKEDDTIAYTWREYADQYEEDPDTADPEIVLRMPMCKVRCSCASMSECVRVRERESM